MLCLKTVSLTIFIMLRGETFILQRVDRHKSGYTDYSFVFKRREGGGDLEKDVW